MYDPSLAERHVLRDWFGQKLRGSFYGICFRRGVRVPIRVPWKGFGVGLRWVVGGGFPVESKGKGWGGGWGQAMEPASPCARVCQNYPLANYPLVSPRLEKNQIADVDDLISIAESDPLNRVSTPVQVRAPPRFPPKLQANKHCRFTCHLQLDETQSCVTNLA